MARNIEIKARIDEFAVMQASIEVLAGDVVARIEQDDLFFPAAAGRLKLRDFGDGKGELIAYERPDATGPSLSTYQRTATTDAAGLRATLAAALGVCTRVIKTRWLYQIDATRIHLDQVQGLGAFLELEVVLGDDQSPPEGQRIAHDLMGRLGIAETAWCDMAYADLLAAMTGRAGAN